MTAEEISAEQEKISEASTLAAAAAELSDSVEALAAAVTALEKKSETTRRVQWVLGGLVFLKAATIIILIFVVAGLSSTNHKIKNTLAQNYNTAQQQEQTRLVLLCPVYGTLLGLSAFPSSTPIPPDQLKARDNAVAALKNAYVKAGCTPPLASR